MPSSHHPLCQIPLMSMAFRRISRGNAKPLSAPHRKTEGLEKTIGQSQTILSNTGQANCVCVSIGSVSCLVVSLHALSSPEGCLPRAVSRGLSSEGRLPEGRPIVSRSPRIQGIRPPHRGPSVEQRYRKRQILQYTSQFHTAARTIAVYGVTGPISVHCMQDKTLFARGSFESDGSSERVSATRSQTE